MQISVTNDFDEAGTLSVLSDDDGNQTKANMEDPSFSTSYTSAGSVADFNIQKQFSTPGIDVGYVAVFGHNIGANGATVVIKVDGVTKDTITFPAGTNNVIMSTFTEVSGALDIDIEIEKNVAADQITITGIAAGKYLDVPNGGEQGGFSRAFLTRSKRVRAQGSTDVGPVAILTQSVSRQVRLSVDAATLTFIEGDDWASLLDLAFNEGYLIIKEFDGSVSGVADDPLTSCLAYGIEIPPPRAHPSTRKLVGFDIQFRAYTGT